VLFVRAIAALLALPAVVGVLIPSLPFAATLGATAGAPLGPGWLAPASQSCSGASLTSTCSEGALAPWSSPKRLVVVGL